MAGRAFPTAALQSLLRAHLQPDGHALAATAATATARFTPITRSYFSASETRGSMPTAAAEQEQEQGPGAGQPIVDERDMLLSRMSEAHARNLDRDQRARGALFNKSMTSDPLDLFCIVPCACSACAGGRRDPPPISIMTWSIEGLHEQCCSRSDSRWHGENGGSTANLPASPKLLFSPLASAKNRKFRSSVQACAPLTQPLARSECATVSSPLLLHCSTAQSQLLPSPFPPRHCTAPLSLPTLAPPPPQATPTRNDPPFVDVGETRISPSGSTDNMAVLPLVAGALVLIALVAGLLNYFGNRVEHAWYVSLVAFISWFFPFSIVVLVPLDLSSTLWRGCTDEENCKEPFLYVSSEFLIAAWRTIYWCSFALTWVMIPMLQAYTQSGEFTVMKRFRHAVRYNIIYQLIVGSVAMLGLVYVWYSQGSSNLRAYVMALSNSWGLILVVIFMGYGMVDVPRRLWHKGDNARELRRIAFKASVVKDKRQDTEDEVLNVAKELSVVCHKVQLSDPLRRYVDRMVEAFPAVRGIQFESYMTASPILSAQGQRGDITGAVSGATLGVPRMPPGSGVLGRKHSMDALVPTVITEKYLANLHARIKRALRMNDRWTAIWLDLLKAGFLAQDIQDNMGNLEKKFRSNLRPPTVKPKEWRLSFEWVWHLKLRPILLRSLSVLCAVLSLLIVWSEMTYDNTNPILSVIGLLVKMARDRMSYGAIEAISFLTMLYMCTCAYTTLMKMKLLNNYVLVPNHHTDEPTLLFIGSYLCRLTFPLVYNYLTISAIGKEDSTEFSAYMGKIDMVPFLGEFNYYMPYLILIPTLITLFNVFAKMFAVCSISDNFFDDDDDAGGIGGDLEEGLEVLKEARRDEERRLLPDRAGMNRDFTARRGAAFESYNNKKNNKNNKNRRRGDTPAHSMLGEGSSANAWRDVRPYPTGPNQRQFQEPYFDDSTDEEDSPSALTGFGRRDSFDPFGTLAGGGGPTGGIVAGGTNVGGSTGLGSGPASNRSSHRNLAKLDNQPQNHSNTQQPPTHMPTSTPGPFRSIWQKFVQPKQAIALDSATMSHDDPAGSDGARSSIESTGQNENRPHLPKNQQHHTGRTFKPDRHAAAGRTGPALMFASVQQQPSAYGRSSLHDEDRDRLLAVGGESNRALSNDSSAYSSRTHSPQGRVGMAGGASLPLVGGSAGAGGGNSRNSHPSSRVFGSSHPTGSGNVPTRASDNVRSVTTGSHRQGSPLLNIFDDDDDD